MVSPIIRMPNTEKHSGISGIPTQLLVLHSGESPLRGGYAQSLTNWANTSDVEASWHWFVDPIAIVSMVDPLYAAWHASEANPMSEGIEQAGYARFSRAEWLTPEGVKQMDNLAWLMAVRAKANGIPARWLTTDQVNAITSGRDRTTKGFCTHRQIDPETRTDPGNGYPYDLLLSKVVNYMSGTTSTQEDELSAKEVQEIKDHINALVYGGASWKGEKRYPLYAVEAETQRRVSVGIAQLRADVSALQNVLAQQAKTPGAPVDMAAVAEAAATGAAKALADLKVTTTIEQS